MERLLRSLPSPSRQTHLDLRSPRPAGPLARVRPEKRLGLASALAWNGWYDPRGTLDGREELPLLLTLARRLARLPAERGACLLFDSTRHAEKREGTLDNRYALGEEDAPSLEHLREMGVRRVRAWVWQRPGDDLSAYLAYLRQRLPVALTIEAGGHG